MRGFLVSPKKFALVLCPILVFAVASILPSHAQVAAAATATSPHPLITRAIDESQRTVLKGNVHPMALRQFDLGSAPATLPMERMLLVLKRSPEQEHALRTLLDNQQDKKSPSYHKWLTPTQFGQQFGPTDNDMATITSWLQSHGFTVGTTKGRSVLEFSGSASQVQSAFQTTIHKYIVNGQQHWANSTDPSIPSALAPAVAGVLTMHNFQRRPLLHMSANPVPATVTQGKKHPYLTFSDGTHALGPYDYATIYNSPGLSSSTQDGFGVKIGIVGRSNLFNAGSDVSDFRNGLMPNFVGTLNIILNGPDPGDLGGGEEAEATLDATWSGAVAPAAEVDLVVSASTNTTDGVDLSEAYIIENDLTDVMSESFGSCELGATDAAGVSAMAEQAAAQGITYFVSTGDNGSAGCDDPNSETQATFPVSVNVLASTAFNVAVGGTVFDEHGLTTYWNSTNDANNQSAVSYIPEDVWNDSCTAANCPSGSSPNISAGSGGVSTIVTKPSWQTGVAGIPADGFRDLPDVSLTSASHDPYLVCLDASCVPDSTGNFFIYFVWGTSAAAPSFAGVQALVDQQMFNQTGVARQGAANYVLYKLASTETLANCDASSSTSSPATNCIFNDVTVGNNAVPGELNYGTSSATYQAGVGYDLATGLGSVNISNLINQWDTVTFNPTTTTLVLNNGTLPITITHGSQVPLTITVAPNSGTVTPTGDAVLMAQTTPTASSLGFYTLSGGTVTSNTTVLPGGTYNVTAHYGGDSTYASSDSVAVPVTVTAENSTTTASLWDQNGHPIANGTSLPFGSFVYVRADVVGASQQGTPTGSVTFTDTFGAIPSQVLNGGAPVNPATLNSQGNTALGTGLINFDAGPNNALGNHSITAAYGSDPSFNSSSSSAVTFSIQPGFAAVSGPNDVTISAPGASGTTTVGIVASTGFTTPVTFTCTGLPVETTCSSASATGQGPNTPVNTNITITTTAAHTTMLQSNERRFFYATLFGGLPLVGIVLMVTPRRRRITTTMALLMLLMLVVVPACGGSSGSHTTHQQDPGTPAGTYQVTVTAAASGATSQSAQFFLVIQ